MKTSRYFPLTLLFLLLSAFMITQCAKEESLSDETTVPKYHLAFSIDSGNFIESLTNENSDFSGVFAKMLDGVPVFEHVSIVDNKFVSQEILIQPTVKKILISESGQIQEYNAALSQSAFNTNFDLTYFPWIDLKMITENSESIYISNSEMKYGASIHSGSSEESEIATSHTTLKIEGDFANVSASTISNTLTPLYVLGIPCPPYWRECCL